MIWSTINFVLFVALLFYALRKPVGEYFAARTDRLKEALAAGARARAEAEKLRADLDRDLRDMPAVRARLRGDMVSAAEVERDRILTQAREAVARIRNDARLLVDHYASAGRDGLRAEVIEEALRQATALVRGALAPGDQERLVRDFIASARAA